MQNRIQRHISFCGTSRSFFCQILQAGSLLICSYKTSCLVGATGGELVTSLYGSSWLGQQQKYSDEHIHYPPLRHFCITDTNNYQVTSPGNMSGDVQGSLTKSFPYLVRIKLPRFFVASKVARFQRPGREIWALEFHLRAKASPNLLSP